MSFDIRGKTTNLNIRETVKDSFVRLVATIISLCDLTRCDQPITLAGTRPQKMLEHVSDTIREGAHAGTHFDALAKQGDMRHEAKFIDFLVLLSVFRIDLEEYSIITQMLTETFCIFPMLAASSRNITLTSVVYCLNLQMDDKAIESRFVSFGKVILISMEGVNGFPKTEQDLKIKLKYVAKKPTQWENIWKFVSNSRNWTLSAAMPLSIQAVCVFLGQLMVALLMEWMLTLLEGGKNIFT